MALWSGPRRGVDAEIPTPAEQQRAGLQCIGASLDLNRRQNGEHYHPSWQFTKPIFLNKCVADQISRYLSCSCKRGWKPAEGRGSDRLPEGHLSEIFLLLPNFLLLRGPYVENFIGKMMNRTWIHWFSRKINPDYNFDSRHIFALYSLILNSIMMLKLHFKTSHFMQPMFLKTVVAVVIDFVVGKFCFWPPSRIHG